VFTALTLPGVPEPELLRRWEVDGQTVVTFGSRALACFDPADVGQRNLAVSTLRRVGFAGQVVARVLGLSEEYVATLYQRSLTQGPAGLVPGRRGRPAKLDRAALAKVRAWKAAGVSNVDIAQRLGVHKSNVGRALATVDTTAVDVQPALELTGPDADPTAGGPAALGCGPTDPVDGDPVPAAQEEPVSDDGGTLPARVDQGVFVSRYAGSMLHYAFTDRVGAGAVLAGAGIGAGRRYDDAGVLTATMLALHLGAGSVEASKHLRTEQLGPLAGLSRLPHLNTLRSRLHAIAAGTDPLVLHRDLAAAMIATDAAGFGLYFVDEHFVAYEGAKPVGKGWNTKRRHAQKGRHDTYVVDYHARAVCFLTGEPAGLTKTITAVLDELTLITGETKVMLGFDRGGSYPSVFAACRERGVDWLTYRRGALAPTTSPPHRFWVAAATGQPEAIWLAEDTIELDHYGTCRQLTLFENNKPVLQVLTCDTTAPAAALLAWLRCRWRIDNAFKYLTAHHGIDWLCDHTADLVDDTRIIDNPARRKARTVLTNAQTKLAHAERSFTQLLADHSISVEATNKAIPTARKNIDDLRLKVAQAKADLATIPAKIAANELNPGAQRAILATRRRGLQMALRLLAYNSELWLAEHLNTYLCDPDEYRAHTRNLLHLDGTITYTPTTITVALRTPQTPRLTRALTLLLNEINTSPPHIPGDPRPITYHLTQP